MSPQWPTAKSKVCPDILIVETRCPICDQINPVSVDIIDHATWVTGTLIQDAFPDLSSGTREQLITGICPKCWDETFKEEE